MSLPLGFCAYMAFLEPAPPSTVGAEREWD